MELKLIFREILERIPDMQLAGDVEILRSNFIGGIKHMPVTYTPGARSATRRPSPPSEPRIRVARHPDAGIGREAGSRCLQPPADPGPRPRRATGGGGSPERSPQPC